MAILIDAIVPAPGADVNVLDPATTYGGLRTVELSPIFQGDFAYTVDNTELTDNPVTGGGTVLQFFAKCEVSTSATPGSTACLMSKRIGRKRAGLDTELRFTTSFGTEFPGTEQLIGLADENGTFTSFENGFTVGFPDSGEFGITVFSGGQQTDIPQSEWDDPVGAGGILGPSLITLGPENLNTWTFTLAGAIAFLSLRDLVTGKMWRVHTINSEDLLSGLPLSQNPNYHFIVWASNFLVAEDILVKSSEYSYFIHGKTEPLEVQKPTFTTGRITTLAVTAPVALFTIRCKHMYAGKTNFIEILLQLAQASIEANAANNQALISFHKNATLVGSIWTDINTTDSVVEIDLVGVITMGTGKVMTGFPMSGKNDRNKLNRDDFGTQLLLHGETITVVGDSVASATINAGLFWREEF